MFTGKFKDEGAGTPFLEGIFLRSKMYSILSEREEMSKHTAKGIKKSVSDKVLTHEKYRRCLEEEYEVEKVEINMIQSKRHQVYSVKQFKSGLSPYNDKRYQCLSETGDYETHSFGYVKVLNCFD